MGACRFLSDGQRSAIIAHLDAGKSQYRVAADLGVSRDAVRYWAERHKRLSPNQLRRAALAEGRKAGLIPCAGACGQSLPPAEFYRGFTKCKACVLDAAAAKLRTPGGKWRNIVAGCRHRARARGARCDLSEALLQRMWDRAGGRCAYTGEPMTTEVGHWNTVSADRIDNTVGGYVPGNIALCCALVNVMKRDMPVGEFRRLCAMVTAQPWPAEQGSGDGTRAEAEVTTGAGGGFRRPTTRRRRARPAG